MRLGRLAKRLLAAVLLVAGGVALSLTALYLLLPNPAQFQKANPKTTAFIAGRCPDPPCTLRWTPIGEISPFLPEAVILAEDPRFFKHHGIDWNNIRHAFRANIREGKIVWGGSSITMQLAKNLYLGPEKTLWRKFREILLTMKIERALSKERILELYLNVAEWGPDLFGVGNAAAHYFQKTPKELTPYEATFLASILPNPDMAVRGEIPERFADAGSRIFARLIEYHLGLSTDDRPPKAACDEPLSREEAFRIEYLVAKVFNEHAADILSGKAALMNRDELMASLTTEERAFIDALLARYPEVRTVVPFACDRSGVLNNLVIFDQTDAFGNRKAFWIPAGSVEDLEALLTAAERDRIFLRINSAYRAEGYQIFTLLSKLMQGGFCLSAAMRHVAHPSESEHACTDALAVDLGDAATGRPIGRSDPAFPWLTDHAGRYHFSLSYPPEGSDIIFEPWHWRHRASRK